MSSDNLKLYGWSITSKEGDKPIIEIEVKCNIESYERINFQYGDFNNENPFDTYTIPANENEIRVILSEIESDVKQHYRDIDRLKHLTEQVNEILEGTK